MISSRMMVSRTTVVRVLLVVASVATLVAGRCKAGERWLTSYDEALAAARETGRPVLTIFTGSDWCPHCHTLEEQVLRTEVFSRWAEERLVLLMIDLPQQGISQEERRARSRVCIKYGVRTFPSALLIGPDGAKIALQTGYTGQSPETWVASMNGHLPAPKPAKPAEDGDRVLSSLGDAVATARDTRRPILVMVSRPNDSRASTRVASLINDPEFDSLARENFVVAALPPKPEATPDDAAALDSLLAGTDVPSEGLEIIVTDDGQTPLFTESGSQPPHRVVSGLRRFLASRQSSRR